MSNYPICPVCKTAGEGGKLTCNCADDPYATYEGEQGHGPDAPEPTMVQRLEAALLDTAGLDGIGDPEPLIHGVLQRDSLAWLAGKPGSCKTFVALDQAGSVGTGLSWQGYPVEQGDVLYVIAEGARGIRKRVRAWEAAAGRKMTGVTFLPIAVQAASETRWAAFCELAARRRPALIVIDTQARCSVGMEENSAKDMGLLVDRLERLRAASGACVLVLHHTPRNSDNLRGSTAMEGAATTIIVVTFDGSHVALINDPDKGGKQKDTEPFDPITLRLIRSDASAFLALTDRPLGTDLESKAIRDLLSRWWAIHESEDVSVAVLVKSGACVESTFHRAKNALLKAGYIAKEGKGNQVRYRLLKDPRS